MRRNVSAKEESSLMRPHFRDEEANKSADPLTNIRHQYARSNNDFSNSNTVSLTVEVLQNLFLWIHALLKITFPGRYKSSNDCG